ncbi:MAG TPA: zf-HC2 domain-containing protein [Thermoanaerobaculia bacterium]
MEAAPGTPADLGKDPGVGHHEELLLRFIRGETTRAETRGVVRHLLAGCPECRAFTSSVWGIRAFTQALYPRED